MSEELPPFSPESEVALLSCVLLDSQSILPEVRPLMISEMFYDFRNRTIWDECCQLSDSNTQLDGIILICEIKRNGKMEQAGGMEHIDRILDLHNAPSPFNWSSYYETIKELWQMRKVLQFAIDTKNKIIGGQFDFSTWETDASEVSKLTTINQDFADVREIQKGLLTEYQSRMEGGIDCGLKTQFYELNQHIGGFRPEELIVVAGTPSAGKTSLVLNIAQKVMLDEKIIGFVSLETSSKKLIHRHITSLARVNGSRFMSGVPLEGDIQKLTSSTKSLRETASRFMLWDKGGLSVSRVVSVFRRMRNKGACLFILDYVQLLRAEKRTSNRNEEMSLVSGTLKLAAKELQSPIIVISSLNRESTKENRPPRLSDLRECGQLEFDADICLLLHPLDMGADCRTIEVNVAKNKDGATGRFNLGFIPPQMRFEDLEPPPHAQNI